jgi:DNA-binding transcriptional ArsR family regulator
MVTQTSKSCPPANPKQAASVGSPLDVHLDPAFFRALADPTRVKLVSCIAKCGRGCTVSEVAECCDVDFSVVSRHLSILAASGVLGAHKAGRTMSYTVRYEHVCASLRLLADALERCGPDASSCCGAGCCQDSPSAPPAAIAGRHVRPKNKRATSGAGRKAGHL